MARFTHGASSFKQIAREIVLESTFANFPRKNFPLCALTFPEYAGTRDPNSVEEGLRMKYNKPLIVGIERDRAVFNAVRAEALALGMQMILAADHDLFRTRYPKMPFHLVFTDYMGGVSDNMLVGWNMMLREGWLASGGVWGVTLNDSGRCHDQNQRLLGKGDLTSTLPNAMLSLMRDHGFKPSLKPTVMRYSCRDESTKAVPMVIVVVTDKGKRRSIG